MEDNKMMGGEGKMCSGGGCGCKCRCHKMGKGLAVMLVGLAFLLETLGVITMMVVNVVWPIAIIIAGGAMTCGCCGHGGCGCGSKKDTM